jgi:hypothetical protein
MSRQKGTKQFNDDTKELIVTLQMQGYNLTQIQNTINELIGKKIPKSTLHYNLASTTAENFRRELTRQTLIQINKITEPIQASQRQIELLKVLTPKVITAKADVTVQADTTTKIAFENLQEALQKLPPYQKAQLIPNYYDGLMEHTRDNLEQVQKMIQLQAPADQQTTQGNPTADPT